MSFSEFLASRIRQESTLRRRYNLSKMKERLVVVSSLCFVGFLLIFMLYSSKEEHPRAQPLRVARPLIQEQLESSVILGIDDKREIEANEEETVENDGRSKERDEPVDAANEPGAENPDEQATKPSGMASNHETTSKIVDNLLQSENLTLVTTTVVTSTVTDDFEPVTDAKPSIEIILEAAPLVNLNFTDEEDRAQSVTVNTVTLNPKSTSPMPKAAAIETILAENYEKSKNLRKASSAAMNLDEEIENFKSISTKKAETMEEAATTSEKTTLSARRPGKQIEIPEGEEEDDN